MTVNILDAPLIILDISRLISRASAPAATGIDRVELAYAVYLIEHCADRLLFSAMHPVGYIGILPRDSAENFVSELAARWNKSGGDRTIKMARALIHGLLRWGSTKIPVSVAKSERKAVYLLVSHHHLTRPRVIAAALRKWDALFVAMIHDLIPIEFPEYSRPREPERHLARLKTIGMLADAVIVPSRVVGEALTTHLTSCSRRIIDVWTVPHGVPSFHVGREDAQTEDTVRAPYFVCLGTIEPRKNHLLLLNLWRQMASQERECVPRLLLIGKRGWENENILDMLDRCKKLDGHIEELNTLDDAEVINLMVGARGLLFPSFSEGFGLPLAEAISLRVPSICADIDVLREVGGDTPAYVDPLDGPGWQDAIDDFCVRGPNYRRQKMALETASFWDWTESAQTSINKVDALAVRIAALSERGPKS